jgi:hypothetical protein
MRSNGLVILWGALEGGCTYCCPLVGVIVASEGKFTSVVRLVNTLRYDSLVCRAFSMLCNQAASVPCMDVWRLLARHSQAPLPLCNDVLLHLFSTRTATTNRKLSVRKEAQHRLLLGNLN